MGTVTAVVVCELPPPPPPPPVEILVLPVEEEQVPIVIVRQLLVQAGVPEVRLKLAQVILPKLEPSQFSAPVMAPSPQTDQDKGR